MQINKKSHYLHRLVLLAFAGPCPSGHEVNHINGDRADNRLENLEYVTSSQNTLHAVKTGTWAIGEKRWNAKLNDDLVMEIRSRYGSGERYAAIADSLGLNRTTVYHVIMGHNWKHVLVARESVT